MEGEDDELDDAEEGEVSGGGFVVVDPERDEDISAATTAVITSAESIPLTTYVIGVWVKTLFGIKYEADLEVECSWNSSGTEFTCHTKRYRVDNIGGNSGNIEFGFSSAASWTYGEITGSARQDGAWHDIRHGGTIAGNSRVAQVWFKYTFDISWNYDPSQDHTITVGFSLGPPTISNPGVVRIPRPTLSGTGATGATVGLYQHGVGTILFGTATVHGDQWTSQLREPLWMADPFTMTASQTLNGITSSWAVPTSFAVLFKPLIYLVVLTADGKPTISGGGGLIGARLEIWHQGGGGGVQLTTTVKALGLWSVSATTAWPPGTYSITARQIGQVTQQSSDWSDNKTFTVEPLKPPKPVMTNPLVVKTDKPTIRGTGVVNATVRLYKHGDGSVVLGTNSVASNNTWTITLTQPLGMADPFTMAASQTLNGVPSDWADTIDFAVLFKPVITTITVSADGKPTVSGTGGLEGATIDIQLQGGTGGIQLTATVLPDGTWSAPANAPWHPNTYLIRAKQIGRVTQQSSDWSDNKTFTVKPPKPAITAPPNPAPANQVLSITGVYAISGVYSGTVNLKMLTEAGAEIAGTFSASGTSRTFTPTAGWTVGTSNKVKVVQTVGDIASDPSDLVTLAIKPPKPAISAPPNPAPANQVLSITGVYSGTVTLKMLTEAGAEISGTFSSSGTSRTFTPTAEWIAGRSQVKVVQTVGGIASDPSDLVTLAVKPPKPAITAPPNPAPANQVLSITGVYSGTVTLKMLTEAGAEIAGTFSASGTSRTFTPTAEWAVGTSKVKVVQTVGGIASDPSDLATLAVKPPKPVMTNPLVVRTDKPTIHGAGVADATVRLYQHGVGGVVLGTDAVASNNSWTITLTQPLEMADPFTMAASQSLNGVPSDWADTIDFAVLFKPVITTITVSADGKPTVSGTDGLEGATIDIRLQGGAGGTQLTATVRPDGTWSSLANEPWAPKIYIITAKQIGQVTQQSSDWSDNKTFTVKPPKPAITQPPNPAPANQVLSITGVYAISGVYSGAVILKMLTEAGAEISGTFATTGNTSLFTPTVDWAPGPHRIKVVQTVNDVVSDPSDECVFTVEVGSAPEIPQFELPLSGAKTSTHPVIRVTGEPLALMTVRREGSEMLHSDTAGLEGVLEFVATTPLVPGPNILEVKQKGSGPESDWSEPHRFTVKELPQTPVIDAPTPGSWSPRKPVIRGRGETRGQILLRHEDDPENLIDTLNGVTPWRWVAQDLWNVGQYAIQVQQTDDGDSSSWSEPRIFEVVDARYGIGDAGPVLAQPVLNRNESALLRVQIVSGVTGEAAGGVEVEWHIAGEQTVLAMTVTDPEGWACYLYTPDTVGTHTVLADLTSENQGVAITQAFEVTALLDDAPAAQPE